MISSKPVTIALGLSLCGLSWYIIYRILKRDDEDDYEETFIKASKFKTVEVKVPKDHVGELIGRNGKNIKEIQEMTGTKINFKNMEDQKDRVCVIKGSIEACHIAENIIREFIENQPVILTATVLIPKAATGKVIGRCGESIADMQSTSGAKITVLNDDGHNRPETKVVIKGTEEQIAIAKCLVDKKVQLLKFMSSKLESKLAQREPRNPAKNKNDTKDKIKIVKNDRLSPDLGQQDTPFEIYVSALENPSRFWIQIVGPKATELDQLVEEMTDYYRKQENKDLHALDSINKGDLVAAYFQFDKKWYRAEVLNIKKNGDEVEVYYVDYGDTDTVKQDDIFELRTDFLQLHFQAIECYLANVEPAAGKWTEEAIDRFEILTHVALWKKLSAKINGYCVKEKKRAVKREGSPVPGVDLYDYNNEKDVNIAEELVNEGFAVFKGEHNSNSNPAQA